MKLPTHQFSITRIEKADLASSFFKERLGALSVEWQYEGGFWTFESCLDTLKNQPEAVSAFATIGTAPEWVGWYLATCGSESAELLFVYTSRLHRSKGMGQNLLKDLISMLKNTSTAKTLTLEVRPSNTSAIRLYENLGFHLLSRRKSYYKNGEDALVYQLHITK